MRWRLAGVLVCVLSQVGCSNDVEKPAPVPTRRVEIGTPRGKILVLNPVKNLEEQFVTADVVHDGTRYTFRISSTGDGANLTGGVSELLDESGRLLFSLGTSMNSSTGEVVFTQKTPDDYLIQSMVTNDERVREVYDASGDVATFEYPALSDDMRSRAANYYEHGLPAGALPAHVAEYVEELAAFDSYYEPHAKSTLHNNPSGELLAYILTAPELKELVGPGAEKWKLIENLCHLARACQGLICYTNPNSLACFACTAVSIACSIVDIICGWINC